jgi:putative ABC transport system permease protein
MITRRRVDDEAAEELRDHLERLTARYRGQGLTLVEARAMAHRQLGNITRVREEIYWMNGMQWLETFFHDVRYACRLLWRAKSFTGAAVLTLTLGIAGTTIMFTLIQGVLLRPLPVHEQDRLILAWKEARTSGSARYPFGSAEIDDVAAASQLLESAAGVTRNGVGRTVLTDGGVSSYANVGLVTGSFFDVLGVQPLLGRTLTLADDNDGAERVVVISSGFWQRRYGARPEVIGRHVILSEQPFTIVGVMPPDLDYPTGVDIWRPTGSVPTSVPFGDAARREVNLIGRLRPGVTLAQATSEITSLSERLDARAEMRGLVPVVRPFADIVIGDVGRTMLALFGAVGFVLLIASANVANLLLMRGEARRGELALRTALGAGRSRIVRQVLAESLVLSAIAGATGFAVAWSGLPVLMRMAADGLPRIEAIRIDANVMLFSIAVVFVTAVLAGITPGLLSLRADLLSPLRGTATGVTSGAPARGRRTLVVAQVALAVTVLAAAGLLVRSVQKLQAIDLGLPAERLVLVDLHMPAAKYALRERHAQFLDEAMQQVESLPAVAAATPVNISPFSDRGWDVPRITAEGQSEDEAASNPSLNLESIHPNYFATFEVPMVRGRTFTTADRAGAVDVAIVSEDLAAALWPRESAIGKRLKMGGLTSRARWLEIVGVAAETRYRTVTVVRPTLYLPAAQFQMTATLLVLRTTASLELLTSLVNDRIRAVDPGVQVMRVAPFAELLDRPFARPRFAAFLLGIFGITALLLASVGLYAVIAAYVTQRNREIAVRLALGATANSVRRLVISEAVRLAVVGAVSGVVCAVMATRFLRGMLFDVNPLDPVSIGGAAVLLVGAAALASYGPVRRAVRADVVTTLRSQ